MSRERRTVAVIGLGTLGLAVARELLRVGDRVMGVDIDEQRIAGLCDDLTSTAIADARSEKAVAELGLDGFDAVVVTMSRSIEASILAATHALEVGCNNVWARAKDSTHRIILERIGVHHVIVPQREEGERLAQRIHNPALHAFINVHGDHLVGLVHPPTAMVGKHPPLEWFEARERIVLMGILRGPELIRLALDETTIEEGDLLLVYGPQSGMRDLADRWTA